MKNDALPGNSEAPANRAAGGAKQIADQDFRTS